jgi:hypothetical protein
MPKRGETNEMTNDPFGNLMEWGEVVKRLDELCLNGGLDECQRGLIRILRFRGNWRLREIALERIKKLNRPETGLTDEIVNIIMDGNIYYEARILALEAMREMITRGKKRPDERMNSVEAPLAEKLTVLLRTPQPPVFSDAIRSCLQVLGRK